MAFCEGEESYTVNVAEIDRQHKQLIELINQVYDALQQGKSEDTMKSAIDELVKIAAKFGVTPELLRRINGLSTNMLQIGQALRVIDAKFNIS